MRGRAVSLGLALATVAFASDIVSGAERSGRPGAVVVRPVQVREVRVNQPTPPRIDDQRPTFGVERPIDPGFISRPIPRPQHSVTSPRHSRRQGRHRSSEFKPRFGVSHGVVVGYPVLYPYAYPYDPFSPTSGVAYDSAPPAPNTYSNVDSLPAQGNVGNLTAASPIAGAIACAASAPCGGLSFDLEPAIAQIFVDGSFAGVVDDFSATSAPLLLAPGDHYVEIRLAGYRTVSFDVTIAPGEVTPYQGSLERLRLRTP